MNKSVAGKRKRSTSDPAQQQLIEPPTSNDNETALPPTKLPRQTSYAQANLLSFFSRPPPKQPKEEDKGRARLEIGYAQAEEEPTTNEKENVEEETQKRQEEREEEEEEEEEEEMKKGGRVAQQLGPWKGASSSSSGRTCGGRPGPEGWQEVWDRIVRYRAEHKVPPP
jgi:flagellar biosynthesis/type III secretory pathway protein FliH